MLKFNTNYRVQTPIEIIAEQILISSFLRNGKIRRKFKCLGYPKDSTWPIQIGFRFLKPDGQLQFIIDFEAIRIRDTRLILFPSGNGVLIYERDDCSSTHLACAASAESEPMAGMTLSDVHSKPVVPSAPPPTAPQHTPPSLPPVPQRDKEEEEDDHRKKSGPEMGM